MVLYPPMRVYRFGELRRLRGQAGNENDRPFFVSTGKNAIIDIQLN
jgi:hypothetical protein